MRAPLIAIILIVLVPVGRGALAADWSFCIAPADAENRIYISRPFSLSRSDSERRFDAALWARHLQHDSVQCPRADNEAAAFIMHQHAIEANREFRRQVIEMPWQVQP